MTDKTIINGIDVSECVYRDYRNRCCCDSSKPNEGEERITGRGGCEYNPNCYFKQRQRAKYYLNKIRDYELNSLDVDYDEYEQHACDTEYSPIIDFVELALGEKEDE